MNSVAIPQSCSKVGCTPWKFATFSSSPLVRWRKQYFSQNLALPPPPYDVASRGTLWAHWFNTVWGEEWWNCQKRPCVPWLLTRIAGVMNARPFSTIDLSGPTLNLFICFVPFFYVSNVFGVAFLKAFLGTARFIFNSWMRSMNELLWGPESLGRSYVNLANQMRAGLHIWKVTLRACEEYSHRVWGLWRR